MKVKDLRGLMEYFNFGTFFFLTWNVLKILSAASSGLCRCLGKNQPCPGHEFPLRPLWFWCLVMVLSGLGGTAIQTHLDDLLARSLSPSRWYDDGFHGDGATGPCGSHLLAAGCAGPAGPVTAERGRACCLGTAPCGRGNPLLT